MGRVNPIGSKRNGKEWLICLCICLLPVQVNFSDEIIIENLRDEQQAFHIDVLAVEYVVERSAGTMDLSGEFCIADATLVHFLLDDFAYVDVLEIRFHRFASSSSRVFLSGGLPLYVESVRNYTVHQNVVSPNTRLTMN